MTQLYQINRQQQMALLLAVLIALSVPTVATAQSMDVLKSASCNCCRLWMDHMEAAGFSPKPRDVAAGMLARVKRDAKISPKHQSCHTAFVENYVIEGHVPAEDVRRLLREKPDAIGLSVPGMPIGSPGMEVGDRKEPYEVLLLKRDGTTEVFARH